MKIIHIITAFGIGGAEKLLLNVINKQVEANEVHLIYFKDKDDLVGHLNLKVNVKQIPFSFSVIKKITEYYKEFQPDVIHTHLGHADFMGVWAARNLKIKVFCTMHNIYFKNTKIDTIFFKIYSFLFLKVVKHGQIISISKSVEEHVINKIKLPKTRSHLLPNAIPPKKIKKKVYNSNSVNLLFVGRLEKQKSLETLLKAIQLLKDRKLNKSFHLNIIGEGKLRENLEHLANCLDIIDFVTFKGVQKNVDDYYSSSDIFILPSIWEGFGIVILEAFRANVAVIASNIEGPAELIQNNVNGFLFKPQNVEELTNKIEELINDEEKRNYFANKGHLTFTEKYHIDNYVQQLNNLYKNV